MAIDTRSFLLAFGRFNKLVEAHDRGHKFTNFREGLAAVWEGYKPRLRDHALKLLAAESWDPGTIGQGPILERAIAAIEIQDSRKNLTNNLVFWQNRFGHATRDHRTLLEAQRDKNDRRAIEHSLFELFRGQSDEGVTFDRLSELTERKYPLLAYLFFLKDMDRFTPIQPTGFDRAFRELGVDLVTLRNCSWENYLHYNGVLGEVRVALEQVAGLKNVRLIDAHSFCWILATLLRREAQGLEQGHQGADSGRVVGARERCIVNMKYNIIQAVQQARGQVVVRSVEMKIKNLGFDEYALEKHLKELMKMQGDKCALTGIPFQFDGEDPSLLPSPDRIDSQGHYDHGNIQIVCRFINFWKGDAANEEFLRLLVLVRGRSDEGIEPGEDDD